MLNEQGRSFFKPWLSVQNFVLAVFVTYIIFLLVRIYDLGPSEVASWVQALGAIASIWGAFAISRAQLNKAADAEKQVKEDRLAAYISVRKSAERAARSLHDLARKNLPAHEFRAAWGAHEDKHLSVYLTALEMVPLHEMGTGKLIEAHVHVTSAIKNMHTTISEYLLDGVSFEDDPAVLYENIIMLFKWQYAQVAVIESR